jgi:hypothetical protein
MAIDRQVISVSGTTEESLLIQMRVAAAAAAAVVERRRPKMFSNNMKTFIVRELENLMTVGQNGIESKRTTNKSNCSRFMCDYIFKI